MNVVYFEVFVSLFQVFQILQILLLLTRHHLHENILAFNQSRQVCVLEKRANFFVHFCPRVKLLHDGFDAFLLAQAFEKREFDCDDVFSVFFDKLDDFSERFGVEVELFHGSHQNIAV